MGKIFTPSWPKNQQSIDPRQYMRNGVRPSGPQVSGFTVGLLNHQLGHRFRQHFCKSIAPSETVASGTGSNITTWRWMMRTMPNETTARVRVQMIPAASGFVNDHPRCYVKIIKDSTVATIYDDQDPAGNNAEMWFNTRSGSPTSAAVGAYVERSQSYALEGDTLYRCELVQVEMSRVVGLSMYGVPRKDLDTSVDVCVDPSKFLVNQPIASTSNADVFESSETLWKRHGSAMAYSVPGTTAKTVASATSTNILDSTTTWTSSTKGFLYPALNKHSLETTLGSATYAVPVQAWVYGSCSGGGTGTVRFRWGTGASDYVQVTGITTADWYKATGTIPGNADQKIDIYAAASAGTVSVYAAGMFDYSA